MVLNYPNPVQIRTYSNQRSSKSPGVPQQSVFQQQNYTTNSINVNPSVLTQSNLNSKHQPSSSVQESLNS